MRPGQAAPVFGAAGHSDRERVQASMRPGQAAPVFSVAVEAIVQIGMRASMRPGQAAPVFRKANLRLEVG